MKTILGHKIIAAFIILIIVGGGYFGYSKIKSSAADATRYVLTQVSKGTINVSISGSGQVSASNQLDIKPKVSGDITSLNLKVGQEVKTGDVLARLDSADAYKTVRDAQVNLQSAQLALNKLNQPATPYNIMLAENALASAQTTLAKLNLSQNTGLIDAQDAQQKAADALNQDYDNSYNSIADTFLDLPSTITNLYNILYSNTISANALIVGNNIYVLESTFYTYNNDPGYAQLQSLVSLAESKYATAREKYDANFTAYQNANRTDDHNSIKSLLDQTFDTTTAMAEAAQSEANLLDYWVDYRAQLGYGTFAQVTAYQSSLATYISQTNSHLTTLSANQNTIQTDQNALNSAQRDLTALNQNNPLDLAAAQESVNEKQASLDNLKAGTDPLDIQSQELTIQQRQNTLNDAYNNMADYTVRAPFDGVVAAVNQKKGDAASPSTAIVTLITKQSIAELSLNEVDAAKVAVGQKANLTFDAVSDLNITGSVIQIDSIGTVSQGVVTYNVKIGFDTQDNRVKPGMSVTANIITDSKQDILIIPNSAIKTQGENHYVLMFTQPLIQDANNSQGVISDVPPTQQIIEIGLANDTSSEITSGLKESDQIVTKTITTNSSTASTNTSSSRAGQQTQSIFGGEPPR